MAYLGRGLDKISNIEVLDNITFDGSSSYSITKGSVAFTPNSAQSCLISIDGVVQATNFTVNSSTIDFGVAIPSTSTCNFFLHYGTGVMTVPSDGSVTTAKLGDGAVTSAKLSAGKILQVVNTEFTGTESTTVLASGGNFADSSLTATLTPSSTSSKIFVTCTVNRGSTNASDQCHVGRLAHVISSTTTPFFVGASAGSRILTSFGRGSESAGANTLLTNTIHTVFSPNTTSAVTVKYQFAVRGVGSGTVYINRTSADTDSNQYQRTASSITLMEIAG